MIRVADFIAGHLAREQGVKAVFMLSGGMMMHLIDAVGRVDGLKYCCNHHEQASATAADAYARVTGKLGVCYATSGPGATNVVTGLAEAWLESSPVLFLTGQCKVPETIRGTGRQGLRQFGTFEVDIVPIVESITKYAAFVREPHMIRYHLEKACRLALGGRPGPVLLDIPLDVQGALIDPAELVGCEEELAALPVVDDIQVRSVLTALETAQRPLILCGQGIRCSGAVEQLRRLVEQLAIPVVTTQPGKDCMPYEHPLFVGHPGIRGDRAGNFAIQNADVLLCLGASLHTQTTGYEHKLFAPHARKIMVDPDLAVLNRQELGVELKIQSDNRAFVESLARAWPTRASSPDFRAWRARCEQWKRRYAVMAEPHRLGQASDSVNYYELVDSLSVLLSGNETIISDAGSSFYVVGQTLRIKGEQRLVTSAAMGAMGFGLPAAIGAAVARPESPVVCITGDGSLHLTVHELATMKLNRLDLKLIVAANAGYLSIRNTQNGFFGGFLVGSSEASGVSFPCWSKLCEAYELPYVECPNRGELVAALRRTLETPGPVVCCVHTQVDQAIMPGVGSVQLADGRMQSSPLHEMKPLLSNSELREQMCW